MIELAIAAFLWAVGTPNGLNLIAFERHLQFLAVLHDIAGKRNGQVVAQSFLAKLGRKSRRRGFFIICCADRTGEVAAVEDFEKEFVALLSIFSHQGGEVFHCGGFNLAETIEAVDTSDGVENIVAARHFERTEIACAFGYAGLLCHGVERESRS